MAAMLHVGRQYVRSLAALTEAGPTRSAAAGCWLFWNQWQGFTAWIHPCSSPRASTSAAMRPSQLAFGRRAADSEAVGCGRL